MPAERRAAPLATALAVGFFALAGLAGCSTTSGGTPVTLSTTTTAPAGDTGPTTTTTAEPPSSLSLIHISEPTRRS